MKEIQDKIDKTFKDNFGYTPLKERLTDIQREFFELMRWKDIQNLKEETGDLLASLIQLCSESGWSAEDLILETINKINSRSEQYKTLGRKTKVAILGGAFDPIHKGHIKLAQFVLNSSGQFDEVWLMPAYEHMYGKHMISPEHRLKMCEIASRIDGRIKVFDYEIKNKLKGETYYFFKKLHEEKELMEKYQFSMIIGSDNANTFDKWVNFEELERMTQFVVVSRPGVKRDENVNWYLNNPHIYLYGNETQTMEVSSTMVKNFLLYDCDKVNEYIDEEVYKYIISNNLYKI